MLSGQTRLGRILRLPLSLIPRESVIPILRGPLRGKKWIAGSSVHGCWAGTYEVDILAAFASAITPGSCVYDIGANVGIFTLLASVTTGPAGKVYAFEPFPRNAHYLRRHIELNQLQNCCVLEVAASDAEGAQRFSTACEYSMCRFSPDGDSAVSCVTLDSCIYGGEQLRPPDVVKMDVEGAELLVLRGATRALSEYHPSLFIEIHGVAQHRDCHEFLASKGYRLKDEYCRITATWEP
jgi:FkbM family methyltransferase